MTIIRYDFHVRTGYRELMRDPAVMAAMQDVLDKVRERAGDGFETDMEPRSGNRQVPRGSVRTATTAARLRQARNHVLERSLDV